MKSVKHLIVFLLVFPLLTGCWDRSELDERAIVLGISIDKADPKEQKQQPEVTRVTEVVPVSETGRIRLTAQLAVPGRIPLGPSGEGGGSSNQGGGPQTVWPLTVVGYTMADALSNLQQQISFPLFFGHLRIIVVSEEIAKSGLRDINEYLRRDPEIRRMTWMAVSKGKAEPYMISLPKLERVPTLYLMATLEQAVQMGKFPRDFVGIFWSHSSKRGEEGFLPYLEIRKRDNVMINGMAYFKGDKMVGVTTPFEIAGYMGIRGVNPAGYQTFVKVPGSKDQVVFAATKRKSKIDVQIINDRPTFTVKVMIEGNLREHISEEVKLDNEQLKAIEEEEAKGLQKGYQDLLKKTQHKSSDIFGFGEYVRAKQSNYWNHNVKTKEKWQEMYKDISVDFNVVVRIRRVGMTTT